MDCMSLQLGIYKYITQLCPFKNTVNISGMIIQF